MIISNIGIFIFVGLLSVLFDEYGWFPNRDMYAISQLAYRGILPVLISYEGGKQTGGQNAGVLAVLAVSGILAADSENGLWGAMVIGPAAGFLWKYLYGRISGLVKAGLEMLIRNLCLAVMGGLAAAMGFFCLSPLLQMFTAGMTGCVEFLLQHGLTGVISVITEPAKVFFLNNLMNHGIFIPFGMEQAADSGRSLFFLLETNPGPGMGLLLAFICCRKDRRSEYGAAIFTQAAGGLHEVYFPYVLSNLWLLLPLIAGGMAGNITFRLMGAGLQGAVSPGSLVTIFLMAGKGEIFPVLAGILASATVSFAGSIMVLNRTKDIPAVKMKQGAECQMDKIEEDNYKNIKKIAVVCDGGVGTSAMGAAILRRRLAQEKIPDIKAEAFAADLVPEDVDLIVCQKDYGTHLSERLKTRNIYMADSLLNGECYEELVRKLQEGIR